MGQAKSESLSYYALVRRVRATAVGWVVVALAMRLWTASATAGGSDEWLERAAEQAAVSGELPRAVTLFRGLAALRPRDPAPLYRLAEVYVLAGQYDDAVAEYRRYAARPEAEPPRVERALSEAKRLEETPGPPAEAVFRARPATVEAKRLFEDGRRAADGKRDESAVASLQGAMLLDPDLPGPYRLLGAIYGRTGNADAERRFLAEYLRVRPDGKIADMVRQRLQKEGLLGTLGVEASWPCRITINGRDTGRTTPLRNFQLPGGKYTLGLENETYHLVRLVRVDVVAGKETKKTFAFGVLSTKLDPWARVRVDGKDVGLWDESGIPEGKHTVSYQAHDGSREKSVVLEIKGGTRTKLSW